MTVLAWRYDDDTRRYVMDNPWTIGSGRGVVRVGSSMRNPQENREQRFPAASSCLMPTAF